MNIHKSRGDRVIVELSSNELSRYELCPEEMDCKNPKTRRLINDVMKRAQRHIRRDITSFDKMNVDVMETDEGCIMILCFKGIKPKDRFRATSVFCRRRTTFSDLQGGFCLTAKK